MKKIISLTLAIAMCVGLISNAIAAPEERSAQPAHVDHAVGHQQEPIRQAPPRPRNETQAQHEYPYHGYPGASNHSYQLDPGYSHNWHGGWTQRPWTYRQPYERIRYGNHFGFWIALAGINTFIIEDVIGQCFYLDQYGNRQPFCDPAYTNACTCP